MNNNVEKPYRVTFNPNFEEDLLFERVFESDHATYEEARVVLDAIANYTLLLHEQSLMPDYSNCGCIEEFHQPSCEWVEIEDVNGE